MATAASLTVFPKRNALSKPEHKSNPGPQPFIQRTLTPTRTHNLPGDLSIAPLASRYEFEVLAINGEYFRPRPTLRTAPPASSAAAAPPPSEAAPIAAPADAAAARRGGSGSGDSVPKEDGASAADAGGGPVDDDADRRRREQVTVLGCRQSYD